MWCGPSSGPWIRPGARKGAPEQEWLAPGWPICLFPTWALYMGTEHGIFGVLGYDLGCVPFPVPAPRKELDTSPSPVLPTTCDMLNAHSLGA